MPMRFVPRINNNNNNKRTTRFVLLFTFILFCIMGKKNESSCARGLHSEQIALKLVSYWWIAVSNSWSATHNQQMSCCSALVQLITTWSLGAEHDSLPEQFETKSFCVLCLLTQSLHLTQVGNRWRALSYLSCNPLQSRRITTLKQHSRHNPPLSLACLSPENRNFYLNLFSPVSIIEA